MKTAIAATLAIAGLLSLNAGAFADTQSAKYVSDEGASASGIGGQPDANVGGVGFAVNPGDSVMVTISDLARGGVNGTIKFVDNPQLGKQIGNLVSVCGGKLKDPITVPAGTALMWVFVPTTGKSIGPDANFLCGAPNGAVTGTITVSSAAAAAGPAPAPAPVTKSYGRHASTTPRAASQATSRFSRAFRQL